MKQYRKIICLLCVTASLVTISACGSVENELQKTLQEELEKTSEKEEDSDSAEVVGEIESGVEESEPEDQSDVTESKAEDTTAKDNDKQVEETSAAETSAADATFQKLAKYEFVFCSGAGAWQTTLNINADGSFSGSYGDSNMGETGDGYPNGTHYSCDFSGTFTKPEAVNSYTYSMKIANINYVNTPETEEIIDGIKYIYTTPYGIEGANEIYIYLPGAPVSELPEEFCGWVSMSGMLDGADGKTTSCGLYNVAEQEGFMGELKAGEVEDAPATTTGDTGSSIDTELANVESQAAAAQAKLDAAETQSDMNEASSELYNIWDAELNQIWSKLKATLDSATMNTLTSEEKEWISYKEQEMKNAGADYEGGSMQVMVENQKGAELTKERVYNLAEYLK